MVMHRSLAAAAILSAGIVTASWVGTSPGPAGSASLAARSARRPIEEEKNGKQEEGHAWEMFEWWYGQRAYPNELIPKQGYWNAWQVRQAMPTDASAQTRSSTWEAIGPDNVGGRMLAVAVDPTNSSRVWAGAASGGLWLSTNGGTGVSAWTRVETGFPSVAVSAVVIDPTNTQRMWIGTGEIGRYARGQVGTPGARSSYGLGVLRSTDGGTTWSTTGLTWTFDQSRAVQALKLVTGGSPALWAATTEGVYKSTDDGANWTLSLSVLMTMDVVVSPVNPLVAYASAGQLGVPDDTQAGIWKTVNGGATWTRLAGGLPTTNFGRTPLVMSADGTRIYAGVSNSSTREVVGLFRSLTGGASWTNVGPTNWASSQAWYDNTIAESPVNADLLLCGGLDLYRSTTGGSGLSQITSWFLGYEGDVPAGGPEGPGDYLHADEHAIVFDPSNANIVYVACDGGIFKSTDSGLTWGGVNGGLQTSQFYNGLAFSSTNHALGGLQDNGTLLYTGTNSWNKTFGGDGGWCAIDRLDDDVLYEEYVYLNMYKSTDRGASWNETHAYLGSSGANFIAPFVLAPSSPSVLYAGSLAVEKSTNGGATWSFTGGISSWNGTPIASIGIAFGDANRVVAATGSSATGAIVEIRRTVNGNTWNAASGYPARYPTDFAYDPQNDNFVWATFSGYGTGHVYRSTDAGLTWVNVSGNLPDLPHQTVVVDPLDSASACVGTDLGVYRTTDGGANWAVFDTGMPPAMILDLVIDPNAPKRRMRAATFGNGVWQVDLPTAATGVQVASGAAPLGGLLVQEARPNPFRGETSIRFSLARESDVSLTVHDATGRRVRTLVAGRRSAGAFDVGWDGRDEQGRRVAAGTYFLRVTGAGQAASAKVTVLR